MTGDLEWTELLVRIAAERGIDFEPMPPRVAQALAQLARTVADLVVELPEPQERRWLAAALAALSHQTHAAALTAAGTRRRSDRNVLTTIRSGTTAAVHQVVIDAARPDGVSTTSLSASGGAPGRSSSAPCPSARSRGR